MKKILIEKYECEYCKELFNTKRLCLEHEKYDHKCLKCEHAYYVYGCEFNCSRLNDNKSCRYRQKK